MTNHKEILRLEALGIGRQDTALACGCSRNTVTRILQRAKATGLTWEKAQKMTAKEVSETLFPPAETLPVYKMPDYEYIHREMQKSSVTLNLLWLEYCDQCRTTGELAYKSTQFNKYYADFFQKTKATMHLQHRPGETMQVDWAGQTAFLVDTDAGEFIKTYIFVAVLPYSGYAYVEAFPDQKQESWVMAHVNAYSHFGGVTKVLTPDNLKTGITKNTRAETVINQTYREMAEHYGTAVLPARPYSPRDKGAVEGAVGIVSTFILAASRNQQFFSLQELNRAIAEKLHEFNHKPFQKKTGSRASAFEEEKPFLLPLPARPFELTTWKVATVQYNYHVSIESQNYSCPYEYIKQKVDVRLTKNMVELFYDNNRIASHFRLYGRPNQYSTLETHMTPDHQQYLQWNGKRFISWAEKMGAYTVTVIQWFLQQYKVEQQGYKACMALLKLSDKYTPMRVENACERVLSFTAQPSLKSIQSVLRSGQDKMVQKEGAPHPLQDASPYGFTRGAGYYGSGRNGQC
jgi:transposase